MANSTAPWYVKVLLSMAAVFTVLWESSPSELLKAASNLRGSRAMDFVSYEADNAASERALGLLPTEADVDVPDCYSDDDCREKVNWDEVSKLKKGILARLEKVQQAGDFEVAFESIQSRARPALLKAGVPADRVEDMLMKWNSGIVNGKSSSKQDIVNKKDCSFDDESQKKVNWDQVEKLKADFMSRLKLAKMSGDEAMTKTNIETMEQDVRTAMVEAGVPDDRVDCILAKSMKRSFAGKVHQKWHWKNSEDRHKVGGLKEAVAKRFDSMTKEEREQKWQWKKSVDWQKVGELKEAVAQQFQSMNKDEFDQKLEQILSDLRSGLETAGVSADQADHVAGTILHDVQSRAWRKLVDWKKVRELKDAVALRFHSMTKEEFDQKHEQILSDVRVALEGAGVPTDQVDHVSETMFSKGGTQYFQSWAWKQSVDLKKDGKLKVAAKQFRSMTKEELKQKKEELRNGLKSADVPGSFSELPESSTVGADSGLADLVIP